MKTKTLFAFVAITVLMAACSSNPKTITPDDLDLTLRQVSDYLNERIPTGKKIAVISIQSDSVALSEYIIDELISNAVNDNTFSVVDRQQLDVARVELDLNLSGEVNDNSAQRVGQFLGVQVIITGRVSQIGDVYRISIRALEVETVQVQGSNNWNIAAGKTITALMNTRSGTISSSSGTTAARTRLATSTSTEQIVPVQTTPASTPPAPAYKIGDTGPASGIIFYDKGNNSGGWRYLEAAPVDLGPTVWATEVITVDEIQRFGFRIRGWNEVVSERGNRAVGMGKSNTEYLVRIANNRGGGFSWAIKLVDAYELNGFDGWFLPSQDELNYMYGNLHMKGLGNFRSERYWSSSMGHDTRWTGVLFANFINGEVNTALQDNGSPPTNYRTARFLVRPVRQF